MTQTGELCYYIYEDLNLCRYWPCEAFEVDGVWYDVQGVVSHGRRPMIELADEALMEDLYCGYPSDPATEDELLRWTKYAVVPGMPLRMYRSRFEASPLHL